MTNNSLNKRILTISLPIMAGMLSHTFMNAVDTAMVGRLGSAELAAVGIAGLAFIVVALTISSISIGVQTLSAWRYGAKKYKDAGAVFVNSIWIALPIGLFFAFLGYYLSPLLSDILFTDNSTRQFGNDYLAFRFLGIFPFVLGAGCRGFFGGIGKTKYYMFAAIGSGLLNIFLDYVLIFGHFGFTAYGIKGAAIASTISETFGFTISFVMVLIPFAKKYEIFSRLRPDKSIIFSIISLSFSAGIRTLVDIGSFLVFNWIVGLVGTTELAAASVIRTIAGFAFMPLVGLSIGTSAVLGQSLGEKELNKAEQSGYEGIKISLILAFIFMLLFLLIPDYIFRIFTTDIKVIEQGVTALRIQSFAMLFSSVGIIMAQCFFGAGKVNYVLIITAITVTFIYLPFTWVAAITLNFGINGAYVAEILYWLVISTILLKKFKKGCWKRVEI